MSAMLEIKGLKTEVVTEQGNVTLIDDISISLAAGEVMGLVGESGSGKSVTGLSIMGLLDKPVQVTNGKILFKGRDLRSASQKELQSIRGNRIAMIPGSDVDAQSCASHRYSDDGGRPRTSIRQQTDCAGAREGRIGHGWYSEPRGAPERLSTSVLRGHEAASCDCHRTFDVTGSHHCR